MAERSIERSVIVRRSAEELFPFLTDGDKLERWFPSEANTEPTEGGRYRFSFKAADGREDHSRTGTFTRVEANRSVEYDWDFGLGETVVRFTLTPEGKGTRVDMSHSGFRDGVEWSEALNMHDAGWKLFLENLKSVIEEGRDRRAELFG
jgi:uncharacterized protein YndB with AHSA1/START domain